jgi:WD40 repeat protein
MPFMDALPDELCTHIFKYLPLPDICSTSLVCKRWYNLCRSEELWAAKLQLSIDNARAFTHNKTDGDFVLREARQQGQQETYKRYFSFHQKSTFVVSSPKIVHNHVFLFRVAEKTRSPWMCGCKIVHSANKTRCANCQLEVQPYQPGFVVASMVCQPRKAIHLVDLDTSAQLLTFELPPTEDPNRLGCHYPLMAVGMESGNLMLYDMQTGVIVSRLCKGHDKVWMVTWSKDGQYLLTLHGNATIVVWRVTDHGRSCVQESVITGLPPTCEVYFMSLDDNILWVSCSDGSIAAFNIRSGTLMDHIFAHTEEASRIEAVQDKFICGSFDKTISMGHLEGERIVVDKQPDFRFRCNGLSRWMNLVAIVGRERAGQIYGEVWDIDSQELVAQCSFPTLIERETTNSSLWFNGRYMLFCASLDTSQALSLVLCDLSTS